jgi:uncharacterized protein YjbI with pentapeptide repeats
MDDNQFSYTSQEVQKLRTRWKEKLLDPGTKQAITYEGCQTFEELLQKRLNEIRVAVVPEIEKVDKDLTTEERTEKLREIWNTYGQQELLVTLQEVKNLGLEGHPPVDPTVGLISGIDLRGAHCVKARFDGAMLSNARFEWAYCSFSCFDGADCTDAYFNNANFSQARFEGANFTLAHFDNAYCSKAIFDGAICSQTSFNKVFCPNASFKNVECDDANFREAICYGSHFDRANCTHAHFDGASCVGASFEGATCSWATFGLAKAFGASFNNAYVKSTEFGQMAISGETDFGAVGEEAKAKGGNNRGYWRDAAYANLNVKQKWKADGYYHKAGEYQFREMKCRRKAKNGLGRSLDWFFYYCLAGYGMRPLSLM